MGEAGRSAHPPTPLRREGSPVDVRLPDIAAGLLGLAAAVMTAVAGVSGYRAATCRAAARRQTDEQRLELQAQELELRQRRESAAHHGAILDGYKELLEQRQRMTESVRRELADLGAELAAVRETHASDLAATRADMQAMREVYETDLATVRAAHEACAAENAALRAENDALRREVGELRGRVDALVSDVDRLRTQLPRPGDADGVA